MRFLYRRQVLGLKTGDDWIILEMKEILSHFKPPFWEDFVGEGGWVVNFKKRYHITSQMRTNKVSLPIAQKLASIQEFHRRFAAIRSSGPTRCPKYGRFRADQYFHMVYHSYFLLYHISFPSFRIRSPSPSCWDPKGLWTKLDCLYSSLYRMEVGWTRGNAHFNCASGRKGHKSFDPCWFFEAQVSAQMCL